MLTIPHLNSRVRRDGAELDRAPSPGPTSAPGSLLLIAPKRQTRHVSRKSKSCKNLRRFGADFSGFRRAPTKKSRVLDQLSVVQQQIWELERHRLLMESLHLARQANVQSMAQDKVRLYYEQFGRGYDPSVSSSARRCQTMESMLRSVLMDEVVSPAFVDIDTFLLQWQNYSRYHAEMITTVKSITVELSEDPTVHIVRCTGLTSLRISRSTIKHFFLPLMEDEEMVQRLIGKTYIVPYVTLFHFNLDGRVFKMEPRADLAAALFDMVSDPFSTVKLLAASQLTDDGCLLAYPESESGFSSRTSVAAA